jgi:hypothetical protein
MDVFRGVKAHAPDHDSLTVIVPLENRSRTDAELPPDFGGDRDLALCRELRMGKCHRVYLTTVMSLLGQASGKDASRPT